MNAEEARSFWRRARLALEAAEKNLAIDPPTAANRAYYAAFYATAALFVREGKTFRRHSALESLVHHELVKTGRWSVDLGADYRFLHRLRSTADYDVSAVISKEDAETALRKAASVLDADRREHPDIFD